MKLSNSFTFVFFNHSFVEVFIRPDNFAFTLSNSFNNLSFIVKLFWSKDNSFSCLLLSFLPVAFFIVLYLGFQFCIWYAVFVFDRYKIVYVVWRTDSKTVLSELLSMDFILTASDCTHVNSLYLSRFKLKLVRLEVRIHLIL